MLHRIFDPDNFLWRNVGKLVDVMVLSLLWLVLCLPVVTAGPATAALYYTAVKCLRQNAPAPYQSFFRSFRENWNPGWAASLLSALLIALLGVEYFAMERLAYTGEPRYVALFVAFHVALILPMGFLGLLFPVLSRFTCGLGALLGNTLRLSLKHLPSTAVIGLIVFESAIFTLEHFYVAPVAPMVTALLVSLFAERILGKYSAPAGSVPVQAGPPEQAGKNVEEPAPEQSTRSVK